MVVCYSITSLGYAVLTVTASYTGFVLARVVSGEDMFSRQWSNLWGGTECYWARVPLQ